jgi:ribosome maturation factor RimP
LVFFLLSTARFAPEIMSQARMPQTVDRKKLDEVIEPIVRAHGAEVVDVEVRTERAGWILRIFVEKLGAMEQNLSTQQAAVDLDLCSGIARDLSPALDVVDVIPHQYHLEISSPGVERTLRDQRDYVRFAGKKAKIRVTSPVRGQKVVVGVIGVVREDKVTIHDGSAVYEIAIADIESGRLVFEFGPASRPGKPGSKKKKSH